MNSERPNPDQLLAQVRAEESSAQRGTLKIFFGYAAGVGKTYAMLVNAQRAKSQGREVVVGYVEPHGRPETEALLGGLESLPPKLSEHRGVVLREFDVDAALARKPELLLVDELAHTNAPGCRHEKRWQDVDELLEAGINVWTTLNVQHIESLNDVIGQITGVVVRETVPDQVLDSANDIELIDITPEELLLRLQAGKVYIPAQAERALKGFFQKGNLVALRELSLRQAAHVVHSDVESARRQKAAAVPWATAERLLVCIGPSPTTARVIRTAKRLSAALDAPWLAVSVDLTGAPASSPIKQQIAQHFRLAERLGAETVTVSGESVTDAVLELARARNVTKILIGKTDQARWRRLLFGTVVDEMLERSGDIDVYVIHGEKDAHQPSAWKKRRSVLNRWAYLQSLLAVGLVSAAAYGLRLVRFVDSEANTVMLFLAAVAWSAFRFGRWPAVFASVLAVVAFDFLFVPPLYTFVVSDVRYVVTFGVMLAIGLVISTLASRLRAQIDSASRRERRISGLFELGKQLSSLYGNVFLAAAAGGRIAEMLGGDVVIYLRRKDGPPELAYGRNSEVARHAVSLPAAQWAIEHDQLAGVGTNTLPSAVALFLPLTGSQGTHGAIGIRTQETERLLDPDTRLFLEACANQLALALERDEAAIDAANARVAAEAEQVRSSLLSSVSHDLKTPLAAIAGASSSLLEARSLDEGTRRELLETVSEEAVRLNRLLENILQMSKLEAKASLPNKQWHVLEEIVGSAIRRTRKDLAGHIVTAHIRPDLPLVLVDGLLMEQVFVNILENAARYTPVGTEVAVRADIDGKMMRIAIADQGPGLPPGAEERVFEKFYRASPGDSGSGSGLGLAISRAIVKAHGGSITASNRPAGGAEFVIRLPLAADPPSVTVE